MNEKEYLEKLSEDLSLLPNDGHVWNERESVTLFLQCMKGRGSFFASLKQETDFFEQSYEENLNAFKEFRNYFFGKCEDLPSKVKEIEIQKDFRF